MATDYPALLEALTPSLALSFEGEFFGYVAALKIPKATVADSLLGSKFGRDDPRCKRWAEMDGFHPLLLFFGRQSSVRLDNELFGSFVEEINYSELMFIAPFINSLQNPGAGPKAHAHIVYVDNPTAVTQGRIIGVNKNIGMFADNASSSTVTVPSGKLAFSLEETGLESERPWNSSSVEAKKFSQLLGQPHLGFPFDNPALSLGPISLFVQSTLIFEWQKAIYSPVDLNLTFEDTVTFPGLPASIQVNRLSEDNIFGAVKIKVPWTLPLPGLSI
jgi:hypothetical protein